MTQNNSTDIDFWAIFPSDMSTGIDKTWVSHHCETRLEFGVSC